MFHLTRQERFVVGIIVAVVLCGSALNAVLKRFPGLRGGLDFLSGDSMYPKLDVNTATFEELVAVPYIGAYTAGEIIAYRETYGPFLDLETLRLVRGIKDKNFKKFSPYLKIVPAPRDKVPRNARVNPEL